jgi:hypothetical protein
LTKVKAFLPDKWRIYETWRLFGFYGDTLFFLVCVVLLWHLVGREFDRHSAGQSVVLNSLTTNELVLNLLAMLWGMLLAAFSIANYSHVQDLAQWNNAVGNIVEGLLFWCWSMILIIFPGYALITEIRSSHSSPATPRN